MLFDEASGTPLARAVFERIADITGGACVDFRSGAGMQREMQEIFEAVAVLAAQGIKALEARCKELPGAIKLLPHLK